ncbi:MAG TPA: MarR family transcriptional regulator [Acidimicrobiales bacterium]|nr:MarR family transcriptional regulator [Acidimicrobiales bacterium]
MTHVDHNLSPSQREVLFNIVRNGPIRLAEVALDEGLNLTMVSRIVAHLESAQFVTRSTDEFDARVVHLAPTDAGRALWQEIRSEKTDALVYAISQLSKQEQATLVDVLPLLESLVEIVQGRDR